MGYGSRSFARLGNFCQWVVPRGVYVGTENNIKLAWAPTWLQSGVVFDWPFFALISN